MTWVCFVEKCSGYGTFISGGGGDSLNINFVGVPIVAQRVKNPTSIHEDTGSIAGLAQWVMDPSWLWLWLRSQTWLRSGVAVAVA